MKILRKLFSKDPERIVDKYNFNDEEWEENAKKEQELIKLRNKKMKNLNKHERKIAEEIYQDVDDAGNKFYEKNQNKSRAIGAIIGTAAGAGVTAIMAKKAKEKGMISPVAFYTPVAGFAGGMMIGDALTKKKNRRIAEKIWEKGDKEQMDYITANKKKKAAIVESYTPIEHRIDKNGDDIEPKKKYNGPSLEERVKEREDHEKRLKELKKEFIKSLKEKSK